MLRRDVLALLLAALWLAPTAVTPASAQPASWQQGWPTIGHDPQQTNRSPVVGPVRAHLLTTRKATAIRLIGPDGTLYGLIFRTASATPAGFDPRGRLLRKYRPSEPPAGLLPNGTLLGMGSDSGRLVAFGKKGRLLWKNQSIGLPKSAQPVAGADDRFYALFEGHPEDGSAGLDVFSARGKRRRIQSGTSFFAAAVAPGGTIYALTYDHFSEASAVEAIDPNARLLWRDPLRISLETSGACDCLLFGRQGDLFVTDGKDIVAYGTAGHEVWRVEKPDGALAMAERGDGTLLVAGRDTLDALSPSDGGTRWRVDIQATATQPYNKPTLIVDGADKAYVGTPDGRVSIIAADGTLIGTIHGPSRYGMSPTCLIAPNGNLVVDGADGTLRIYG